MRALLLAHGRFGPVTAKTAVCLIRYRRGDVVGVVDRDRAGKDAGSFVPEAAGLPVVASVGEALKLEPDTLVIGVAPIGGGIAPEWRPDLRAALEHGMTVLSGMHTFLGDDPELAALAQRHNAKIVDVRRPPRERHIATGEARQIPAIVVLTVGTDCSGGKMTAAVDLHREALRRGLPSAFVATGQTGILVGCDAGVAVDALVGDFMAGAVERMVLECAARGKRLIWVEGQGAASHPAYSGVSVALLHGASPDYLVMCHDPSRHEKHSFPGFPTLPLREEIALNEHLLKWHTGGKVVSAALMTPNMSEAQARDAVARAQLETGLPTTDTVRFGPGPVLDAVLEASQNLTRKSSPPYAVKR